MEGLRLLYLEEYLRLELEMLGFASDVDEAEDECAQGILVDEEFVCVWDVVVMCCLVVVVSALFISGKHLIRRAEWYRVSL